MQLLSYLQQSGIKPAQFAKSAGLRASTISRVLSGARIPRIETIQKIEKASAGAVSAIDFLPAVPREASA